MSISLEGIVYHLNEEDKRAFLENKSKIEKLVDNQFQKALSEVNEYAKENGLRGIKACPSNRPNGPFKFRSIDYFDLREYEISVFDSVDVEYDFKSMVLSNNPLFMYLGNINPNLYNGKKLKFMALSGDIDDFSKVYAHWKKTLKKAVDFYNTHRENVLKVRSAVAAQFVRALKDAEEHAKFVNWGDNSLRSQFTKGIVDKFSKCDVEKIQPLKHYNILKAEPDKGSYVSIGCITPFSKGREALEEIILDNPEYDFKEVHDVALKELTQMIDKKVNNEWFKSLCTLL